MTARVITEQESAVVSVCWFGVRPLSHIHQRHQHMSALPMIMMAEGWPEDIVAVVSMSQHYGCKAQLIGLRMQACVVHMCRTHCQHSEDPIDGTPNRGTLDMRCLCGRTTRTVSIATMVHIPLRAFAVDVDRLGCSVWC